MKLDSVGENHTLYIKMSLTKQLIGHLESPKFDGNRLRSHSPNVTNREFCSNSILSLTLSVKFLYSKSVLLSLVFLL